MSDKLNAQHHWIPIEKEWAMEPKWDSITAYSQWDPKASMWISTDVGAPKRRDRASPRSTPQYVGTGAAASSNTSLQTNTITMARFRPRDPLEYLRVQLNPTNREAERSVRTLRTLAVALGAKMTHDNTTAKMFDKMSK